MERVILVRYGEIHLKGMNRPFFERKLADQIRRVCRPFSAKVEKVEGRVSVYDYPVDQEEAIIRSICRIFGVYSVSPAIRVEKDFPSVSRQAQQLLRELGKTTGTFKVVARRSDKKYPYDSMGIARELGGELLEAFPDLKVDVKEPEFSVYVEIRDVAYLYVDIRKAYGGMPLGSNGKAMLLLSGGIDSPVAGWMMSKRGVELEAVHFFSFPYTSDRAKQKVLDLAKVLAESCGPIRVHVVPFTAVQERLYEKGPDTQLTILMRRAMMKIAEELAVRNGCQALATGESIGQVASQTIFSLGATNDAVHRLPVLRPLICFDKEEIMNLARQIGTYDLSILPYEDCCTVFLPKHPATKPKVRDVIAYEQEIEGLDALIAEAVEATQVVEVKSDTW